MLYVSILTSDRSRDPELWCTMWQGEPPPSINVIGAYNLASDRRVFIWEGESVADLQFMDRFNCVGILETYPAFDRTDGWRNCFAKDLDNFADRMLERAGRHRERAERAVDLRRRGLTATTIEAAQAAAREWQEEQAQVSNDL